jgi:large subunit ribosomal protein L4
MELKVVDTSGKETSGKVKLSDKVFGIEPNDHAIYLDVKRYLAAQRQGTHASKHRGIVSGSTKKLKRQKGTGGARIGSIKSPLLRGGGRAFGPEPRDYTFKLNSKVKTLARKSALSYKAKEKNIIILNDLNMDAPKTKALASVRSAMKLASEKVLFVLPDNRTSVVLSARNLKDLNVVAASDLNTYQIMNAGKLVILEAAVNKIETLLN